MSEPTTAPAPADDGNSETTKTVDWAGDTVKETTFEPITSQADLDKIIGQRVARVKAQYAGHADYKAKAEKLDEIEQASKTELQREREAREAAETRAAQAEHGRLRSDVAREKGVPAGSLTGTTKEELEASADELIAWRDSQKSPAPKPPATSTSGDGFKSGATGAGDTNLSPKDAAAAALRRMRAGG